MCGLKAVLCSMEILQGPVVSPLFGISPFFHLSRASKYGMACASLDLGEALDQS